jgi:acyl-CoA reductase-like NAD-dependent aldehyde dehydrogenase
MRILSTTASTTAPIRHPDSLFIGGAWIAPSTNRSFDVIQPFSEELYFRVAEARHDDVSRAVTAARVGFDRGPWPRMTHRQRAEYLRKIATGIRDRTPIISQIWSSEMGILHAAAQASVAGIAGTYDYYANLADKFAFEERHEPTNGGSVGLLVREPVGVVGAIIPWNGPMTLIALKTAPALLAGCTVVVKASPEAPGAAYVLAEIAEEIGLPPGVINCVTADREVSESLVRDPRVDKISFTGSTAAGHRIASLCGDRIARVTLELGGKSAGVVLDDYDLEAAAESLTSSAIVMTGQVCSAITRVVVSQDRHDALVDALSARFAKVKVGNPFDAETQMGPLAMARQRDRVEGFIAKGREEGAIVAVGGGRPKDIERGFFIEPTVFARVDNASTIACNEIFGPVLTVTPFRDEAHAIEIANDTIYGLNAAVFTNDPERALRIARQIRSGTVGHNAKRADFGIAFGGFKQSGIGREGGKEGLLPYLEIKTIILDAEPPSLRERMPPFERVQD